MSLPIMRLFVNLAWHSGKWSRHGGCTERHQNRRLHYGGVAVGHINSRNGMGSQGASKILVLYISKCSQPTVFLKQFLSSYSTTGADRAPHHLAGGHRERLCRTVHLSHS